MKHSCMTSNQPQWRNRSRRKKASSLSQSKSIQPSLFDTIILEDEKPSQVVIDWEDESFDIEWEDKSLSNIWQAVAVDFDGEEYIEYVEAHTEWEADAKASQVFQSHGVGIYQMFLYSF